MGPKGKSRRVFVLHKDKKTSFFSNFIMKEFKCKLHNLDCGSYLSLSIFFNKKKKIDSSILGFFFFRSSWYIYTWVHNEGDLVCNELYTMRLVYFNLYRKLTISHPRENSVWTRPAPKLYSTVWCTNCPTIDLENCRCVSFNIHKLQ